MPLGRITPLSETKVTETPLRWGLTLARITVPQPNVFGTPPGRSGRVRRRFLASDPESRWRDLISGAREKNLTVFAIYPWPNPASNYVHAHLNALANRADTCTVSRLYGHVREFSPAREEKVIVMQQVTEIYGRENGWGDSGYHKWVDTQLVGTTHLGSSSRLIAENHRVLS